MNLFRLLCERVDVLQEFPVRAGKPEAESPGGGGANQCGGTCTFPA